MERPRAGQGWELLDDGALVIEGDMVYRRPDSVAAWLELLREPEVTAHREALTTYRSPATGELSLLPIADRRDLTYCVSRELVCALPGVREAIRASIDEWESVADVVFRHVPEEDATCGRSSDVFFAFVATPGRLALGRAEMPGEARPALVELFPENWGFVFAAQNPVDQLRTTITHELGHSLGFGHAFGAPGFEQTEWAGNPLCTQGRAARARFIPHHLSDFDADSIMNYLSCGRAAVSHLSLGDARGASELYCAPGHGPPPCTAPPLSSLPPRPTFDEVLSIPADCPNAQPPASTPERTCAIDSPGACVEGDVFARVMCDGSPGYVACEGSTSDEVLAARCTCTGGEWVCPCADGTRRSDCAPDPAECRVIGPPDDPNPSGPRGCAVGGDGAPACLAWLALAWVLVVRGRRA